jgi:hypothetical protein
MKKVILSLFVIAGVATGYAAEEQQKEGEPTVTTGTASGSGTGTAEVEKLAPTSVTGNDSKKKEGDKKGCCVIM